MWVLLSLVAAVGTALRDVASKRAVRRSDPIVVALGIAAVPAISLGAIVLASGPVAPGPGFWLALLISGGINAVTTPLVVVALQRSDLSLVAPLTSLTPLFMLGTGVVVLGELPGPAGMAGVATIVAGAYLLALPDRSPGPLGPFRALLHDPGARAMLLVAFLYSISATYDKVGARASSPLFWAAAVHALVAVALAPLAARRLAARRPAARRLTTRRVAADRVAARRVAGQPSPAPERPDPPPWHADILLAGAFTTMIAAAQMTAILLTLAAHVIAVKRTSTLFGVALGHSFFGEQHVRERMLGAAVMMVGFLLVMRGA
jgi:drug/metabolite transporter (DMT)-like permease